MNWWFVGAILSLVDIPFLSFFTERRYTLNESFFEVLKDVGAKRDEPYEWKDVSIPNDVYGIGRMSLFVFFSFFF